MQTILMPVDFSDVTDSMAEYVAGLCPKLDAEVCVLHVSDEEPSDPNLGRKSLETKLGKVVSQLQDAGCTARSKLVFDSAIPSILDQVRAIKPALVVVGSHGHSALHDLLVGSVAQSLLRSGPCPVLVVPAPRPEPEVNPVEPEMISWDDTGYPMF